MHEHFANRDDVKDIKIKILTSNIKPKDQFQQSLSKLKVEINIEVRQLDKGIIHDRYFIDSNGFWLSGNSINNLGAKESFIVRLEDKGIRDTLLKQFEGRWNRDAKAI